MQIVVLDRGFVYVGETHIDHDTIIIKDAQNIRYWGTQRGLGQLALEGPQSATKLDPTGTVHASLRAVICRIDTEPTLWKKS